MPHITCLGHMSFNALIFNELTKKSESIVLHARIIDSPIDIIVGRPTIIEHQLLRKCHDQILADTRLINHDQSNLHGQAFKDNDIWLQLNLLVSAQNLSSSDDPVMLNNTQPVEPDGSTSPAESTMMNGDRPTNIGESPKVHATDVIPPKATHESSTPTK